MWQNKLRFYHELGVSFGQRVSHKPNGLQMVDHGMEESGLEIKTIGISSKKRNQSNCIILIKGNVLHL